MYFQRYPTRVGLIFFGIFCCLLFFSFRLLQIQIFHADSFSDKAERQHNHIVDLEPRRGTIYDRNMHALALNVTAYSLYANPRGMNDEDKEGAVSRLGPLLGVGKGFLDDRMNKDKYFVWLKRRLSPEEYAKIKDLHLPGIGFVKESRRFYPNGSLAAHVIGFSNIDNEGLQGVEAQYDRYLRGKKGKAHFLRDAKQRDLLIEREFVPAIDGYDVVLTIDETIQFIAEKALEKSFEKYHARGATVIVLDPATGEVLAFANRPTFRPDDPSASPVENRTNRAVAFVYEPGSAFKIVTAAAALESGNVQEEDVFFCENGKYRVANHYLGDAHPYGNLTFREVIEKSSNIGTVKVAQKIGRDKVYEYARRFRFGIKTNVGMMGEVAGTLKHPSRWSKTSIGAVPIGQEVTATSIQIACAIAAVANNGVYMKPYFIKQVVDPDKNVVEEHGPEEVGRVMTEETAARLKAILQGVVDRGTGQIVKMKDITAAGKTGTAQKVVDGAYSHSKFFSSFIGFAPVESPKLAIVVSLDEPRPAYYGGTVAGPVFREIVENSLHYLANKEEE